MGWPRGVPRKGYVKKSKEVVPPDGLEAQPDNAQSASQPVTEVRAQPRPRLSGIASMKAAPKGNWKMKAGNLWDAGGIDMEEAPDVLKIPRDLYPEGVEFMWGTRSVRGQEMPQIRNSYRKAGWLEVHGDDFEGSPFQEFAKDRWARDDGGYIVHEACILLATSAERAAMAVDRQKRMAKQQLEIREQSITGGGIQASGANDPSALGFNKIKRTVERIEIPKD